MNNFEALKTNFIPYEILDKMLKVSYMQGTFEYSKKTLEDSLEFLESKTLEKNLYALAKFLKFNIGENRLRLLITKDSKPLNKEEASLISLKEVLLTIQNEASSIRYTGSEILQYLNRIYGKNTHKFTNRIYNELLAKNFDLKKTSIRAVLEKMIDEYYYYLKLNLYEKTYLLLVVYLEFDLMRPFSDHAELSSLLALYYMLIENGYEIFKYVSFFELFFQKSDAWHKQKQLCYINFPTSPLNLNDLNGLLLDFVKDAFELFKKEVELKKQEKRMYKSDGIEVTIFSMPASFTKEDVRKFHPSVSESTLNRVLFKLRDEGIIIPLGKGRSARWIKTLDKDDPKNIFGANYDK